MAIQENKKAKLERRREEFEKTMCILVDAAGIDHTQSYWLKNWHEFNFNMDRAEGAELLETCDCPKCGPLN